MDQIEPTPSPAASAGLFKGALYPVTSFLGAFLLFLIEPLIAKRLLPWFGGGASVWITCLVFFQTALLLGYLYADSITRYLSMKKRVLVHVALLLLSLLFLPVALNAQWKNGSGEPAWRIIALLVASIGLPYLVLSATSPLIQDWFARAYPGKRPYHLFSLSNFASLLALLSYPFLLEPLASSRTLLWAWSIGFGVYVVICISTAWFSRDDAALHVEADNSSSDLKPSSKQRLLWLALSACGSVLLLSITNHLCQNIAPVPLLWVVPLAFYLLTFVIAFNRANWYPRWWILRLLVVMLAAMGYALYDVDAVEAAFVAVPVFCLGLFFACWFCHGELNRLRPVPRYLTSFYLSIAVGGALGAVFVGLVAPLVFENLYEMPVALLFTALLAAVINWNAGEGQQRWASRLLWSAVSVAMAVVVVMEVQGYQRDSILMMRSFYGALRVVQSPHVDPEQQRTLFHGTITHGSQYLLPPMRFQPTTYYTRRSGAGYALRFCCTWPKRVGVIGLGAGTLATYGNPGDSFRFYEINPQVIQIAQTLFTYLRDSKAKIEIIPGDARLSLEAEPPQEFDVLIVDAFSGDAIPVHLLTREAMALYLRHLQPNGIIAFHVSNNYLQLAPVVERLAQAFSYKAFLISTEANPEDLSAASQWVLVTRKRAFAQMLSLSPAAEVVPIPDSLPVWNDDYNNLLQVLAPIFPEQSADPKK